MEITSTETALEQGDESSPYTLYILSVRSLGDGQTWTCKRRFKQFAALHKRLSERFPSDILPSLPRKKFFGSMARNFVQRRKEQLQGYLTALNSHQQTAQSETFLSFVEAGVLACNIRRRAQLLQTTLVQAREDNKRTLEVLQQREAENALLERRVVEVSASVGQLEGNDAEYSAEVEALTSKLTDQAERLERTREKLGHWRSTHQAKEQEFRALTEQMETLSVAHARVSASLGLLKSELEERTTVLNRVMSHVETLQGAVAASEDALLSQGQELAQQVVRIGALDSEVKSKMEDVKILNDTLKEKEDQKAKLSMLSSSPGSSYTPRSLAGSK
mmetsp:Transcript_14945/g.32477  ORF Transcript_14945/g.32477 Transcript_14945/m.32477 type:complete len:333 (+) Transcript_14945:153-1151(+)